jgi:hypothetical protein
MIGHCSSITQRRAHIIRAQIGEISNNLIHPAPPASISNMSLTRTRVPATIGRPPQMAGSTAIRGKPAKVMIAKLSDKLRDCYSGSMPDDAPYTASDFDPPSDLMSPEDPAAYDAWFRAQVVAAMASDEPCIPHDQVMAELRAIIAKRSEP